MRSQLSPYIFWNDKVPNTPINVLCMLENGVCVSLPNIPASLSLDEIKNILWTKGEKYLQKPKSNYVFVVVSSKGGTEELVDEKLSLFDIKPVRPYMKVIRKQGDEELKKLKSKINMLIGHNVTTSRHEEVQEAQKNLTDFCNKISNERGKSSWFRRAIYTFPPDFAEDPNVPESIYSKFPNSQIHLSISVSPETFNVFKVSYNITPLELIGIALKKHAQILNIEHTENPTHFMIKVFGMESYFLGTVIAENRTEVHKEIPLIQYKYIRESLLWDKMPTLTIIKKNDMEVCSLSTTDHPPMLRPKKTRVHPEDVSLWNLNPKCMFRVKVAFALDLNAGNLWNEVRCGVFHGGDEICETKKTSRKKGSSPAWNEWLEFDLPSSDLPRMARLCFCVVGCKSKKEGSQGYPLAWVNMPLFNYKGILQAGLFRLYCSQYVSKDKTKVTFLNPLGTVMNINESGPCLAFELEKYGNKVVKYPSEATVLEKAAQVVNWDGDGERVLLVKGGKQHKEQIEEIIKRDSLAEMYEEDKELLWKLRADCCLEYPQSLPKLLQCVKWNCKEHVAQFHFFLQSWNCQDLGIDIALELLDYKFPDLKVRQRAVEVLDDITDIQLEMYLLHLVQALKYESYLDSPLARYLLRRALNNRRIGHYLFWHLKADVSNSEYSLQFGLLLQLYCYGAVEHVDIISRQVEAINKMKTVTQLITAKDQDKDKRDKTIQTCFELYERSFTDLISPLDPRKKFKCIKVKDCKAMDSKKRPLWLVFQNYDKGASDVLILFKNGDDLRQDMLTLLSLRLMDSVWKSAGLDYGIIPYRCLSTGHMVGLIEVVVNAETIGKIHAARGLLGPLKEDILYSWLVERCNLENNEEKRDLFIRNFTKSVVGYSVAMYVLGVGDRHNDNIMMKYDTGQLFHIDFGHFLGNFKTKLGFRREFVKFVLTRDIVYVIEKRRESSSSENFNRFKQMCIEAHSCLRRRGNLFITVFAMLLSTGIPELENPSDIDYLRETLALNETEEDSRQQFSKGFDDAYRKRNLTTTNFVIHIMAH